MLSDETHEEGDGKGEPQMVPHDWSIINVDDAHDVLFWSSRFDCTRDQLREAVKAAGNSVHAIEQILLKGKADPPRESFDKLPKP